MKHLTLPLLIISCLLSGSAFASEDDDGEDNSSSSKNRMEEIVVSAHQLDTTIDETQYSLSIFLEDDIKRSTDRDLNDLLRRMPNVELDPEEGLIVRGQATRGIGGDLGIHLFLVDGAWTPGIFHKWDIDQLEVLRGSQSTVGSSAGGTFGMRYKDPSLLHSGRLMLNYEPEARDSEVGFAHGGPLIDDTLAFRFAVYERQRDGRVSNTLTQARDWSGLDETYARFKLTWFPNFVEGDELSSEVYYLSNDTHGSAWLNQVGADGSAAFDRTTAIERQVFFHRELSDLRFRYKAQLTDRIDVHAIASYHTNTDHRIEDRNNQPGDDGFISRDNDNSSRSMGAYLNYRDDNWFLSGVAYSFIFNTNNTTDFFIPLGFFPGLDPIEWRLRFVLNNRDWYINGVRSTFGYDSQDWSFMASLSFDDDRADTIRNTSGIRTSSSGAGWADAVYDGFLASTPQVDKNGKYHQSRLNPSLSFTYHINDQLSVGAKAEQASRRGWDRINGHRGQIYSYDPETARDYDLFVRSNFLSGDLTVNANLFFGNVADQQIDFCFSSEFLDCHIVNAGKTRRQGLEVDSWLFLGNFRSWIAASYLEAEFDSFKRPVLEDNGILITNPEAEEDLEEIIDRSPPNSPKWKLAAGMVYETDRLFASLDMTLRPGTSGSLSVVDIKNDSRFLVNGRVGWKFNNNLELSLWTRNLTDQRYFHQYSPSAPGAYVGDPREFGVTLEVNWGE